MTPTSKPAVKKPVVHKAKPAVATAEASSERFYQGLGGRKTASARVRVWPGKSGITINNRDYKQYFATPKNQMKVMAPLEVTEMKSKVGVTVLVKGSGINAQADAVRHGIARALVAFQHDTKKALHREGFMTRDARAVERKKYGLKGARRAPQWAKR